MLIQNQILDETYQIIRPLGAGGTSTVYLAYHLRLQKYVAVKQIANVSMDDFALRVEVDMLKNLHHPNLPQVYDFIRDGSFVYTVIDYVDGYDLDAYIKAGTVFTEDQLKRYLRQIADALAYLHQQEPSVIHSDIKPGNIILDQQGNAILIDFNISVDANVGDLRGLTPPYASPEQLQMARCLAAFQDPGFHLDGRSDLYSLGATFYTLLTGIRPTPDVAPTALKSMGLHQYSREFLALIDQMMAYDREKRVKSARKLVTTLDRMDGRYRAYFAARCASLLLSACLISGGIYCCIRGAQMQVMERYQRQITAVTQNISAGYLDQAMAGCEELLEDDRINAHLQEDPVALAQVHHAMGEIYYDQEQYANAASYFDSAVSHCDASDTVTLTTYLRDAAMAYAQNGDLQTAQARLQTAEKYHASSNDLLLVQTVIDARSGRAEACLANAQLLLDTCDNAQVCSRAAVCAATVAPSMDERIRWLELARSYDSSRIMTRQLAYAYAQKGQSGISSQERTPALEQAAALYEELNRSEYASIEDRINYSVVLRMQAKPSEAAQVLQNALEQYPGHYRVLTNLCFAYNELRDESKTASYCEEALNAWKAESSADRLSETSEEIQNLLELCRRYGIGGIG